MASHTGEQETASLPKKQLRTVQFDSKTLNQPNHVSAFEHHDKVFFLFREMAVEHINCGKVKVAMSECRVLIGCDLLFLFLFTQQVTSTIARVCKNDEGGGDLLRKHWTSFFKARLNCSVPGELPFYFDHIGKTPPPPTALYAFVASGFYRFLGNFAESASGLGRGSVSPTISSYDPAEEMFYAVFNTPE